MANHRSQWLSNWCGLGIPGGLVTIQIAGPHPESDSTWGGTPEIAFPACSQRCCRSRKHPLRVTGLTCLNLTFRHPRFPSWAFAGWAELILALCEVPNVVSDIWQNETRDTSWLGQMTSGPSECSLVQQGWKPEKLPCTADSLASWLVRSCQEEASSRSRGWEVDAWLQCY